MCDWGYCKHNGPATWGNNFPVANGPRQSPIDILTGNCALDADLKSKPLSVEIGKKATSIINTGAGWKVNFSGEGSVLEGGPLGHKYKVEQFHCHWGPDSSVGSEHTVDGKAFPAEIHLVHWNCDKYASFEEAVDKEDGLAVLGIFFTVGSEHAELKKVVDLLAKIPYKDESCAVDGDLDPATFLPENQGYWTYPGSLTTPPCLESVTWIVFKDPVEVSEEQLEAFRQLSSIRKGEPEPEDEFRGKILANYRPPFDGGAREVKACE